MKAIMTSRFLLLIFVCNIVFGCTQNASFADPSADLLNNISERFKTNEYVNALDMGFTNPHEQWGEKVENLFQKMIKHPLITEIKRSPYNASITTLGIKDPNKLILAKTISTEILSSEGYSISEKQLDDMNSWFNKYLLNSEGVISMLNDAEKDQTITTLEHKIIKIELQEMAAAKTQAQIQNICSTVEYEINNSRVSSNEKEKL